MINNLKDLSNLLKLCRKQGVTEIKLGEIQFKLGDLPSDLSQSNYRDSDPLDPYAGFPQGELSPEQLAFYSSGGLPENDPYIQRETQ